MRTVFAFALCLGLCAPADSALAGGSDAAGPGGAAASRPTSRPTAEQVRDLFWAAMRGDTRRLRQLLDEGIDPDTSDDGLTPLHCAAELGELETIRLLLTAGADINARDEAGMTPLMRAASIRGEDAALLLIEKAADVSPAMADGTTALHLAVCNHAVHLVRKLIEKKANVNIAGSSGLRALHYAALDGHEPLVSLLLGAGALVNAADEDGWTPLCLAVRKGHERTVKTLTDAGAKERADLDDRRTMLHLAVQSGKISLVERFLGASPDVNARDWLGHTATDYAKEQKDEPIRALLVRRGGRTSRAIRIERRRRQAKSASQPAEVLAPAVDAKAEAAMLAAVKAHVEGGGDVDAPLDGARPSPVVPGTPLKDAAEKGYATVVAYLLSKGAKPNVAGESSGGLTAVHWASTPAVLDLLAAAGGDIRSTRKTVWGQSPVHVAAAWGRAAAVRWYLDKGLDIDAKSSEGETPLHLARDVRTARVLLDAGADPNARTIDTTRFTLYGASGSSTPKFATPLHYAARRGRTKLVRYLIEAGAVTDIRTKWGRTPLDFAAERGHLEATKALEQADPKQDLANALRLAAAGGHVDVCRFLLDRKADPNAAGEYGRTALHEAARKGEQAVAELLLSRGADPNAVDKNGHRPRDLVDREKHGDLLKRLEGGGTPPDGPATRPASP